MSTRMLAFLFLACGVLAGCSHSEPARPATDFVLHSEDELLAAWGDPEDLSWEEDGTKVLLYLENVKLDHSPDLITSSTFTPRKGGVFRSGPVTTIETWEGTEFVTEHRFWVNDAGIIVRCESRLR